MNLPQFQIHLAFEDFVQALPAGLDCVKLDSESGARGIFLAAISNSSGGEIAKLLITESTTPIREIRFYVGVPRPHQCPEMYAYLRQVFEKLGATEYFPEKVRSAHKLNLLDRWRWRKYCKAFGVA